MTTAMYRRSSLGTWLFKSNSLCGLGHRFLPFEDFAQIFFERGQKLLSSQRASRVFVGHRSFISSSRITLARNAAPVRSRFQQRSDPHQSVVLATHVGHGAAPQRSARRIDQPVCAGLSSTYLAAVSRKGSSSTNYGTVPATNALAIPPGNSPWRVTAMKLTDRPSGPSADCGSAIR